MGSAKLSLISSTKFISIGIEKLENLKFLGPQLSKFGNILLMNAFKPRYKFDRLFDGELTSDWISLWAVADLVPHQLRLSVKCFNIQSINPDVSLTHEFINSQAFESGRLACPVDSQKNEALVIL